MSTDRRRAAATATVGAGATYAGGVLRHQGVRAANAGEPPAWQVRHPLATHPTRALFRTGAKGRRRYLLGASLGLVGAPALAVGGHDYVVRKARREHSFVNEGLRGTQDALEQRVASAKETPPQHKIGPIAVAAGAGALGSLTAHRGMDRLKLFQGGRHHAGRAGLAATAGTAMAAASLPLSRHTVRDSAYEVTPAGVRRRKKAPVRPSSKAQVFDQRRMSRRDYRNATVGEVSKATGLLTHLRADELETRIGRRSLFGQVRGEKTLFAEEEKRRRVERIIAEPGLTRRRRLQARDDLVRQMQAKRARYNARLSAGLPATPPRHIRKVHNPHNLVATTSRGTTRKVHWRRDDEDHAICGLDGAFGRGTGPFAEHYGEVTCNGCARLMNIAKADYRGRNTSHRLQGAAILAAGTTPVVGPLAAAHQAARFAPPGEGHHAAGTQYVGTTGGGAAGGIAGAYGLARLADHNPRVQHTAERALAQHTRMTNKVTSLKPVAMARAKMPRGGARTARLKANVGESKLARPLRRNPVAAAVGYYAGSKLGSYAGSAAAMRHNFREQDRYNLKHPVVKYVDNMTTLERRKLSRKKRYAAASSTTTGVLGLGALAARAKKKPEVALNLLTGSAAIGGVNNLNFAGVLRREAKATDPHAQKVTKGVLVAKADRREPLTRMHADTAAQIVRQHGDAGPLPNHLSRDERMQAYEARYVHAGGHKAERWQHRADRADKIKTGGLAGATAGGVGIMALRSPRVARALGHRAERARHAVDSATIGAATVSGAGELYAGHARRRRSSYTNATAGVAASALRRMRDYSS